MTLAFVPLVTAAQIYKHHDQLAQQADRADLLDQEITAARTGQQDVVVDWSPGPSAGPLVIDPGFYPTAGPKNWVNQCMARY